MSLLTNFNFSNGTVEKYKKSGSDIANKIISSYKDLEMIKKNVCTEMSKIPTDANSINKFALISIISMIENNISISSAIDVINYASENTKRFVTIDIETIIKSLLNTLVSSIESEYNKKLPDKIDNTGTNLNEQETQAPAANMNLGFDVTRFMNRTPQQNMNVYNSSVPNTGYVHQNAAQQQQQYMNEAMNNMIADIREKIDFSNNHITFTNNPDEYKEDIIALSWLCNNENIRFQLINMGVAPGAKFICVENDNPAYKYKFTIGGKTVYLSLKNTTGVDGKVYFAYNIC